jgi:hypothetical protein
LKRFAALALLSASCGYALVGKGTTADPSIKRIGVPMFRDATGKPGFDQKVTEKVIEELLKRGRFDVVPRAEGVDAVVEGEIVSYQSVPVGLSETTRADGGEPVVETTEASRYAVLVVARVKYSKVGVEQPIWSNENFRVREEYDMGDDQATYFDREDQALDRLAGVFARNVVAAMLEAF